MAKIGAAASTLSATLARERIPEAASSTTGPLMLVSRTCRYPHTCKWILHAERTSYTPRDALSSHKLTEESHATRDILRQATYLHIMDNMCEIVGNICT